MKKNSGLTLVEVMLATIILVVVGVTIVGVQTFMSNQKVRIGQRVFATQKTIQMMEEMRSLVNGSETMDINVLDDYDDGATFNAVLTTNKAVTDPTQPTSGNTAIPGGWKYLRQISVVNVPNNAFARQVYVRFYRVSASSPTVPAEVLSETTSILQTIQSSFVPTVVYDVYIIAIENVPGWWSSLPTMVPMCQSVISDLQMRNPGLTLRTHWISRLAYGRDMYYTPYSNNATYTNTTAMPLVYFYPGLMSLADGTDYNFYAPDQIQGRVNIDGVVANPNGYSVCDKINHAVRYPDEVRLYNYYVAQAAANNQPTPEISLRMLMEELSSNPGPLKNILLVNLHGELLPLPPMRNYADPAKDPINYFNTRLVTHPEQLQYAAGSKVNLRVYPYTTGPCGACGSYYSWSGSAPPASPFIASNLLLTTTSQYINFCSSSGTFPVAGVPATKFAVKWTGTIHPKYTDTYTLKTITDDGVRVYLDGSPVAVINDWNDHAVTADYYTVNFNAGESHTIEMDYYQDSGACAAQLFWYSQNYQPTVPVDFNSIAVATVYLPSDTITTPNITVTKIDGSATTLYQRDTVFSLTAGSVCLVSYPAAGGTLFTLYDTPVFNSTSSISGGLSASNRLYGLEYIPCPVDTGFGDDLTMSSATKNTARWIISFAAGALSSTMHTIQTRIGNNLASGTTSQYNNLSQTYVWVGTSPPVTEQYQLMGDPRHCPYLDVKNANGYNWYFCSVPNTVNSYTGFTQTADGWGDDAASIDVPRFYQIYRQGLLNTQAIWSAMNGFSYYYFGMGGEFGSDTDPLPNAIPFIAQPWSTTANTNSIFVDEILPYGPAQDYCCIVANTANSWYSKYWLGELYPDDQYSAWVSSGNISTGVGNYYRTNNTTFSDFDRNLTSRTVTKGCSSFINGVPSGGSGPFCHNPGTYTGNLTNLGLTISSVFNFPLVTTISAPRPFVLDFGTGNLPPEWNNSVYSNQRTVTSIPGSTQQIYYDSSLGGSYNSSAVIQSVCGSSTCFYAVSGLATEADFGTFQMGKFVFMSMLQGYLEAGLYTGQNKISQVPTITLTSPLISNTFYNATSINIAWTTQWLRWDGQPYTTDYPGNYSETTTLGYSVKYTPDHGVHWYYCSDNSPAVVGQKVAAYMITATSYSWPVASFARGSYIISVECYRQGIDLHYSYDQIEIYLNN